MEWKSILLGVGLGVILVPVCLLIGLRLLVWFISRKLRKLGEQIQAGMTPSEITLVASDSPPLAGPIGFSSLGRYAIPQMPGVEISAWMSPDQSQWAVGYNHPARSEWWDLISMYSDGGSYSCSSLDDTGLEPDPRHRSKKHPGASLEDLLQKHLSERPRDHRGLSSEEFVPEFCRCYRETIEWRLGKGTTRQEMVRVAQLSGQVYDESTIEAAFVTHQAQEVGQLEEILRQRFLSKTSLTPGEWEKVRDQLVFVHDRTSSELRQQAQERGQLLGTLEEPVACQVYALPEEVEA
jgi:hypothetical protein